MDWMSHAAGEAATHLEARLRPSFGRKAWAEFSGRLDEQGERLFRLLHRLFGWRYDFAWVYEQMIQVAADGFLGRPKPMRKTDRKATDPPGWLADPGSLLAAAYLDRYAGTLQDLRGRFDHLTSLGVTHLHLLPRHLMTMPDGEGVIEPVVDYRLLGDGGTGKQLRKVAAELREIDVALVLDLAVASTSSEHPWALAASSGDPRYKAFYFMFPDTEVPGRYAPHLRPSQDRKSRAFSWEPGADGGAWVWSTLGPLQWDLNYANPEVLAAMAAEMLLLANLGAGVIRVNGAEFLWKELGTSCENLPEAHVIVQIFEAILRISAPSTTLLCGTLVPQDTAITFVGPEECRLAYNSLVMSSVWEALATDDTRLLARALGDRYHLPTGCAWITYLRSHDEIGWWFRDEDAAPLGIDPDAHRRYLTAFYRGDWPGSSARGELVRSLDNGIGTISGTAATLAGLEEAVEGLEPAAIETAIRRGLAPWAVLLGAGGVPMLFLGDEIAQLSDHAYSSDPALADDPRWSQRPFFEPARLQSASAGEGPEGAILAGFGHLLRVRSGIDGFGPGIEPEPVDLGDSSVIGFNRGPVLVVVNMTGRPVILSREALPDGELFDLIARDAWDGHLLGPYEYRWVLRDQTPEAG